MKSLFPPNFLWGGSTASHQVEGGNSNQWSEWEQKNADRLAKTAEARLGWVPVWNEIESQATNKHNYISGKSVDHFRRYAEDIEIASSLNLNCLRFGIEWSRVEPVNGQFDDAALDHYRNYITTMKQAGLEPVLNIWHWTLPSWFSRMGGFEKRSNIKYFLRFVQKISDELAMDVTYVITLNEPNVYASFGYLTGEWPPNQRSWLKFMIVYYNLSIAHRRAYALLKKQHPHLQIGLAQQLANIQAKRPHHLIDQLATKFMRYFWNWWFLNRCQRTQDFIGFNYYFTDYFKGFRRSNPKAPLNDMGWYMEPEGLYPLLIRVWSRYKRPIIVTENGVADMHDEYRQWWIEESIVAMERAISEGVDLRGYLHWSLLDNFEWAHGWWPKFGLVAVDLKTLTRTIRPSAHWFASKIASLSQKG